MKKYISIFLVFCSLHGWSQNIPANRQTDFSSVGVKETKPVTAKKIDIDSVLRYYPQLDLSNFINTLISSEDSPLIFLFGNGDYSFNSTVHLEQHTKLLGLGEKTKLVFSTSDRHCITVQGNKTNQVVPSQNTIPRGSSSITFDAPPKISVGETYLLNSNDSDLVTSSWALKSTGQILTVEKVTGKTVEFAEQINREHKLEKEPYLIKINPTQHAEISNLSIRRTMEVEGQGSSVFLKYANNCHIKCVSFYNADFAHISLNYSANNTVEGCYFQDAFNYGGGGNGYGVVMQFASSNNLVYNNIFKHLRHSILLQAGANGNAVAYNYSTDPYWTETWLPANSAGDLVLHGNYVYSNLFEGNCVQNIVIDGSHGKNGRHNLFFSNRAENYGLFMDPYFPSDSQLFIGNEITNRYGNALYMLSGKGHFEYGNKVKDKIIPEGTENATVASFLPNIFSINSLGLRGDENSLFFNAAELRYSIGLKSACETSSASSNKPQAKTISIYPNPSSSNISIDDIALNSTIVITNGMGQIVKNTIYKPRLDISDLPSGWYMVEATGTDIRYVGKFLVD